VIRIPALRTRVVNLAVVTMGLGVAISLVIMGNKTLIGTPDGTPVGPQKFFGFNVDGATAPRNYFLLVVIGFTLALWLVINVRRSRMGRRMLAVRGNERAAAALGINVYSTKLWAFAFS